ncbi:MAG TPA: isoprenylcysteine carboxylmethyltransferase family protein [Vicinamibacterales bacterium]|jgi:methyltransferase|nr:isoprenylcysteine carboxylmethyltransferase family protein [Vicinamibacterales bacterium]
MIHVAAVALGVFLPMLFEAIRSSRNEQRQRARGGLEPSDDVYATMQYVYPAAFAAMLVEGAIRGSTPLGLAAGVVVFVGAKLIKWWAILALGPQWTFRVIVVPGDRRVTTGPYRYVRHPNYIGVMGELVGAALLTGAWVSGSAAVMIFGALLRRRIAVEERATRNLDPMTR